MEDESVESYSDLQCRMKDKGYPAIDKRRISEYANGTSTPSFETATMLFDTLNYSISNEDLSHALKVNKELNRFKKQNSSLEKDKELRFTSRIKLSRLLPGKNPSETRRYLQDRISDLFGRDNCYTDYITLLIRKDLNEFVLSSEDTAGTEDSHE